MSSLLALAGLNLDRTFPELGADAADRRRSAAMTLLLGAIREAQGRGVDALVFVGGLFDDRCVGPRSIESLVQILDAYPGQVLIAPGADSEGVYAATNWGSRTYVWSAREFVAAPELNGDVHGRAGQRQRCGLSAAKLDARGVTVLVDAEVDLDESGSWVAGRRDRHVITSGSIEAAAAGVTVLGPANPDLGEPWAPAVVLTYDGSGVIGIEQVSLTSSPSAQTFPIEVSVFNTTSELLDKISRTVEAAPEWSVIELVGELAQGVLLPATAQYDSPRDDVAIRTDAVGFAFTAPADNDHTAVAEFVRSVCGANADARDRHQSIALGLAALVPSNGADAS